jgi:hypothetical protein
MMVLVVIVIVASIVLTLVVIVLEEGGIPRQRRNKHSRYHRTSERPRIDRERAEELLLQEEHPALEDVSATATPNRHHLLLYRINFLVSLLTAGSLFLFLFSFLIGGGVVL